jgi:hypothetical protein
MDAFDPYDPIARQALLRHHPLIVNEYTTITPSLPKVLNMVLDAVMLHKKSLCFNALPQMGKTTACNFCATTLGELDDYDDRFVLVVSVDPTKHESIIRTIAIALGLSMQGQFRLENKRQEVVNAIDSQLRGIKGHHFVLFLDEIQALKIVDFENLQFIQNFLALRNIGMTVLGFGQTQIEQVITVLRAQGRPELIVRFLNEIYNLPRCEDESWVRSAIGTFDSKLIFPVGSDCTYTQFFLPEAYGAGFRLESYSAKIFSDLSEAATSNKLPAIPTAHIFETFRLILIRSRYQDSQRFVLDDNRIAEAVKESQIAQYSSYLKKPEIH